MGTIDALLGRASARLADAGVPDPDADAEWMLADLLAWDRGKLRAHRKDAVDARLGRRYLEWIERRERREPLQHILGAQEFHGLSFRVDGRVLIPRPETEGLVDAVLGLDLARGARIVDLGTGSGCIAVTLAVKRPDAAIHALELSTDALHVARENARAHGVEAEISWCRGDLADPPARWLGRMHVVVSNPPYVAEREWAGLQPEVRDFDPRQALVPGPSGLEAYAALAPSARELLVPGGHLLVELGQGQSGPVVATLGKLGFEDIAVDKDLRGIERVLRARWRTRAVAS